MHNTVAVVAMITEFIKYRGTPVSNSTWIKLDTVGLAGSSRGGDVKSSLGRRNAQEIIQKNGKIITIPRAVRIT